MTQNRYSDASRCTIVESGAHKEKRRRVTRTTSLYADFDGRHRLAGLFPSEPGPSVRPQKAIGNAADSTNDGSPLFPDGQEEERSPVQGQPASPAESCWEHTADNFETSNPSKTGNEGTNPEPMDHSHANDHPDDIDGLTDALGSGEGLESHAEGDVQDVQRFMPLTGPVVEMDEDDQLDDHVTESD